MSYPYGSGQGWNQGGGGYPGQQPGYPAQGGGGYPQPGGGYPQPGGGYPQPGGGYPQPGYPGQQPGSMPGMPQPSQSPYPAGGATYPGANVPYPAQPGIGFGGPQPAYGAGLGSVPPPATYNTPQPPAQGYAPQPTGYSQPQTGYPQSHQPAAYGQSQPGYPQSQPGYNQSQPPQPGYNQSQPPAASYPSATPPHPGYAPAAAAQAVKPGKSNMAAPTKAMAGMSLGATGTLKPYASFNPEQDSEVLRKAMKGCGTDEKAIIDVLGCRSNEQRQKLVVMFKTMYGKDLVKELKSELGGHFEDIVVSLLEKPANYDANQLRKAMKGIGTDEAALIEIMCTRKNAEIHAIRDVYKKLHKHDLEKDLSSETSGHFKRLMVSMSTGGRQEGQPVDHAKAKVDADQLYKAGEKKWGTDESKFNMILASQSFEQLRAVFDEYQKVSKKTIENTIKSEMSGDLETGMLTIVKIARNPPAYFAEKLYKSMKGLGTDDNTLVRIVVTRCEVDMVQIKQEFHIMYSQTLEQFIQGDVSGDYKKMLLMLVRG